MAFDRDSPQRPEGGSMVISAPHFITPNPKFWKVLFQFSLIIPLGPSSNHSEENLRSITLNNGEVGLATTCCLPQDSRNPLPEGGAHNRPNNVTSLRPPPKQRQDGEILLKNQAFLDPGYNTAFLPPAGPF